MKLLTAAMSSLALVLVGAPGNSALADDDEDYVKVEIKGTFNLPGVRGPRIETKRQDFQLDLQDVVGGPPTEKQLKEWDGKVMIVQGRLELQRDARPLVHVTRMIPYKKPDPDKN